MYQKQKDHVLREMVGDAGIQAFEAFLWKALIENLKLSC